MKTINTLFVLMIGGVIIFLVCWIGNAPFYKREHQHHLRYYWHLRHHG